MTVIQERIQVLKDNADLLAAELHKIGKFPVIENAMRSDMAVIKRDVNLFNYKKLSTLFQANFRLFSELRPKQTGTEITEYIGAL